MIDVINMPALVKICLMKSADEVYTYDRFNF